MGPVVHRPAGLATASQPARTPPYSKGDSNPFQLLRRQHRGSTIIPTSRCVRRAPEPCDVLWRTTGGTGWRLWLGPAATVAAVCLLLALSFALQYGLAAAAAHQSDGRCASLYLFWAGRAQL